MKSWPRGFKTFFILSSAELEIPNPHKYRNSLNILLLKKIGSPNVRIVTLVSIAHIYTPGIYADGYIVFAFPFVRSSVRMFVSSFVRSFVR